MPGVSLGVQLDAARPGRVGRARERLRVRHRRPGPPRGGRHRRRALPGGQRVLRRRLRAAPPAPLRGTAAVLDEPSAPGARSSSRSTRVPRLRRGHRAAGCQRAARAADRSTRHARAAGARACGPWPRRSARRRRRRAAPPEVLDDPVGVADRLAVEDAQRHGALPRQRLDLRRGRAGATAPGPCRRRSPCLAQLARDAAAGAQPVRGRAAAVERGHQGAAIPTTPPACRSAAARPARSGSGWRVPGRRSRSGSRSRYQSIVASSVSSWWAGFQPSSRLAFVERKAHHSDGGAHLADGDRRARPAAR